MYFILHYISKINEFIHTLKIRKLSLREINKLSKAAASIHCYVWHHTQTCLTAVPIHITCVRSLLSPLFSNHNQHVSNWDTWPSLTLLTKIRWFDALIYWNRKESKGRERKSTVLLPRDGQKESRIHAVHKKPLRYKLSQAWEKARMAATSLSWLPHTAALRPEVVSLQQFPFSFLPTVHVQFNLIIPVLQVSKWWMHALGAFLLPSLFLLLATPLPCPFIHSLIQSLSPCHPPFSFQLFLLYAGN